MSKMKVTMNELLGLDVKDEGHNEQITRVRCQR